MAGVRSPPGVVDKDGVVGGVAKDCLGCRRMVVRRSEPYAGWTVPELWKRPVQQQKYIRPQRFRPGQGASLGPKVLETREALKVALEVLVGVNRS